MENEACVFSALDQKTAIYILLGLEAFDVRVLLGLGFETYRLNLSRRSQSTTPCVFTTRVASKRSATRAKPWMLSTQATKCSLASEL